MVMGFSISLMRQPLAVALLTPLWKRSEYPPRVVYEVNLGIASLTIVDHRAIKTAAVPAGYFSVNANSVQTRILEGDLVLDGREGHWRYATARDIGEFAKTRLGVARRSE